MGPMDVIDAIKNMRAQTQTAGDCLRIVNMIHDSCENNRDICKIVNIMIMKDLRQMILANHSLSF